MIMKDINEVREEFRKDLEEKCRKAAECRGEEFKIITKTIPFTNDDVPRYLAILEKIEEKSRCAKIMVGDYARVA